MTEKSRLFRSLLLEPLECRSVFSVDGLDFCQFSHPTRNFDVDPIQPAQYPRNNVEVQVVTNGERRSTRGSHHGRYGEDFDGHLPPADGEGPSATTPPFGSTSQVSTQLPPPKAGSVSNPALDFPSPPRDVIQAGIPREQLGSGNQVGSGNSGNLNNHSSSFAGETSAPGNSAPGRVSNASLQNSPVSNSVVPFSNTATQVNLAASSTVASNTAPLNTAASSIGALSALTSSTTTFDFSSRSTIVREQSSTLGLANQLADDFHFAKPRTALSDSVFDQALIERVASLKALENLLSDLAENHRRVRQSGFDATQPNSRSEQNSPPETAASVAIAFADGGMIALALNRDFGLSDLEDISEDARSENKAWIANVGIFRAFENGAVAATEYIGLTNRVTSNAFSNSTTAEVSEVEVEVANSQLQPLLASTSAALGAAMFGLRRIRKSTPPMFTSRKRLPR